MLFSIFSIFTQLPSEFIALLLFERMLLPLLFCGAEAKVYPPHFGQLAQWGGD